MNIYTPRWLARHILRQTLYFRPYGSSSSTPQPEISRARSESLKHATYLPRCGYVDSTILLRFRSRRVTIAPIDDPPLCAHQSSTSPSESPKPAPQKHSRCRCVEEQGQCSASWSCCTSGASHNLAARLCHDAASTRALRQHQQTITY